MRCLTMKGSRVSVWISLAAAAVLVAGCTKGGAEHKVAPVKGKVTANGQPVKGGNITFQPIEVAGAKSGTTGKPATAAVNDDGTFVLSTYGKEDGAVVGKHRVLYLPAVKAAESYDDKPSPSPYAGMKPKPDQIEVQAGPNDVTIEIAP